MSFALDNEDDQPDSQVDENRQGQGTATTPGQSQTDISLGGGGSGTVSAGGGNVGGGASPSPPQPQKPSSSGSWTNLQSYLDANADQGAQVGSQIAGTIGNQATTAQNDVNSAASDFTNNVNANTVNANPDLVNRAIKDATSLTAGSNYNPDDLTGFQSQANATYNGPTDFTQSAGYGQAQKDLSTAQSSLDQTKSETGRDVLLQNQYKNASTNGYNQGEQNLDQLLLEGNPTNQKTFSDLNNQWSGIGNILSDTTNTQNAAAQNAISANAATAAAAKAALGGATTDFQNNLNTGLQEALAKNSTAYQAAVAQAKAGAMTPELMAALGIRPGESLFNTDLSQFISQNSPETIQQSANVDQYAQYAALSKLAGTNPTLLTDPAQSGVYDPYNVSGNGGAALMAASANYNQARNVQNIDLGWGPQSINDLNNFVAQYSGPGNVGPTGGVTTPDKISAAENAIRAFDQKWGEDKFTRALDLGQNEVITPTSTNPWRSM